MGSAVSFALQGWSDYIKVVLYIFFKTKQVLYSLFLHLVNDDLLWMSIFLTAD